MENPMTWTRTQKLIDAALYKHVREAVAADKTVDPNATFDAKLSAQHVGEALVAEGLSTKALDELTLKLATDIEAYRARAATGVCGISLAATIYRGLKAEGALKPE